jgi:hypothetical protein
MIITNQAIPFVKTDGGRAHAGFSGDTGDCVTRAIAIATKRDYRDVYEALFEAQRAYGKDRRDKYARHIRRTGASPRNGVHKNVIREYMASIGWEWVPTMKIGQGCTVHLRADELPPGRLVVSVSKHLCAVVDGVLHDKWDCSRGGTRCVYGYWHEGETS